jgi:hypothetical protein
VEHLTSSPAFQPSSNIRCLGIGLVGEGAESLGFTTSSLYYSSSGIPEESVSLDLTGMDIDEVGFGWSGQQQLFNDFRISDDPFDLLDDFQNFGNLSASELYVPEWVIPPRRSALSANIPC